MEIAIEEKQRLAAQKHIASKRSSYQKKINIVVPQETSIKLRSYFLIEDDLKLLVESTDELIKIVAVNSTEPSIVGTALWRSIVVTYGKIFTKSKTGFSWLTKNSCYKEDTKLLVVHETLMGWRNKFVAHRELSDHEHSFVFFTLNFEGDAIKDVNYQIKGMSKSNPSITEINGYLNLFKYLQSIIAAKISSICMDTRDDVLSLERNQFLLLVLDDNGNSLINAYPEP